MQKILISLCVTVLFRACQAVDLPAMFLGCGQTHVPSSRKYAEINHAMHNAMAINFTGNPEYDFLAGMIPHHQAATSMCDVYRNATSVGSSAFSLESRHEGICCGSASLCYNITYGPTKWGEWQSDFSQQGETDQMLAVLKELGMLDHYKSGCGLQEHAEHANSHSGMFMGCGQLQTSMTKEYLKLNMWMHTKMSLNYSSNEAVNFLKGMIPHHEAAVEMCAVYYRHWTCRQTQPPSVCRNPMAKELVANLINQKRFSELDVLNYMHHICTEHILVSQPPEIQWMRQELRRISADQFAMLELERPCETHDRHTTSGNGSESSHAHSGHTSKTDHGKDQSAADNMHGIAGTGNNSSPAHSGHNSNISNGNSQNVPIAVNSEFCMRFSSEVTLLVALAWYAAI